MNRKESGRSRASASHPEDGVPPAGALVALLPEDAARAVQPWRVAYDPAHEEIPPHVTVLPPPLAADAWAEMRTELAALLRGIPAFEATLAETEMFSEQNVLWLRPDDDGSFERLESTIRERLAAHLPPRQFDYVPHVTIGFLPDPSALAQARREVAAAWQPTGFQVDSLAYVAQGEDGVWRALDRLPLGPGGSGRAPAEGWPRLARWLAAAAIAILLIAPLLLWREQLTHLFVNREELAAQIRAAGAWGPLALLGLILAQTLVAPLPGQGINFVAGYLYGLAGGLLYSWLGLVLGSAIAMALARYAGRSILRRLIGPASLARADALTAKGLRFFLLAFLIPFLPDDLLCFAAGLTPLPLRVLIPLAAVGRLPGILAAVWLGAHAEALPWQAWAGAAILALAGLWLLGRYGRRFEDTTLRRLGDRRKEEP